MEVRQKLADGAVSVGVAKTVARIVLWCILAVRLVSPGLPNIAEGAIAAVTVGFGSQVGAETTRATRFVAVMATVEDRMQPRIETTD